MKKSNFIYLEKEYPILWNIGQTAEYTLYSDPIVTIFKVRMLGEKITELIFEEHYLEFPFDNTFHNRLKSLQFEDILPTNVLDLFFTIKGKGNQAVHDNKGSFDDAKSILFSAFKLSMWFYQTYGKTNIDDVKYSLPKNLDARHALHVLSQDYDDLEKKYNSLLQEREIKEQSLEEKQELLKRSELAAKKIDWDEKETRKLIDKQLQEAGWEAETGVLDYKKNKTLPEKGRRIAIAEWPVGSKWADYALFIGTDLYGIVEAKKYESDISTDLQQSKIYSELAEDEHEAKLLGKWRNYNVPFLFSTNGRTYLEQIKTKSGVWFLDVRNERNHSKALRGWYSPEGILELYKRNIQESNDKLKDSNISYLQDKAGLSLRDYQIKAIEAVEKIVRHKPDSKKTLLAMATGTGKTRTIIGLCYRLIKANRFKRILFLVDRRLLATQAINNFEDNKIEGLNTFAETYKVDKLKATIPDLESRLHFSTVQSMVKRLFYGNNEDVLPIDTYDCIIVDEAHRGYLQDRELDDEELNFKDQRDYVSKYRMVVDYFDAFTVGLTATPALHTTEIFGHPVYTYSYREAVIDGYLIDHEPPNIIKTKLSEEGITWKKGEKPKVYIKEDNRIEELDELEDELNIDIEGFNKMVITESFNRTVAQQLVKEIDPEGDEKTLIFAAKDEHADLIVQLLKEEYENIGIDVPDDAIAKITGKSYKPQELVTRYKNEKFPSIAVTVDLLTTGIDVPPICNLVFLRRIKSRILYEQMLGRATRRCDDIGKEVFNIFDAVKLYESLEVFSSMKPVVTNPKTSFTQLIDEFDDIESNVRAKKQLEQIISKLQRKKTKIIGQNEEIFKYNTEGKDPEAFINMLKNIEEHSIASSLSKYDQLWRFLDEFIPQPRAQYVSEHDDEYLGSERGYGKGQKPEDYLNSFKIFLEQNLNKVAALQIICTKPKELDRHSLKELKLLLDQKGFNSRNLNAAWKDSKNEDIVADIISYIRTLALGSTLISHEERIRNAVDKVRSMKDWNKIQLKWIDRFEKQLIQETIIKIEDLNKDPFMSDGGFKRLNKIFEHQLKDVIETLNDNLYIETA
ncbi:type I restriction-modification system endonuclease [Flavivirga spongiicola]|uniref:Type I restriction-modification system endonuclease n=1 Tax=Flavivirga spongiicola TaxID=421621 RepID=A0ABU7XTT8_9FLAO|nr:type I restriction-modification system endonuclease [Flavivirga sp. MEBiC05379]MDO5978991.1 type I restriction-modification system endonuclease [Flavivirga sp. MEBiC05379]